MVLTSEHCGCELREKHFLAGLVMGEIEENTSELQFHVFKLCLLLGQESLLSFGLWKGKGLRI